MPEPEPEPVSSRISRRVINRKNQQLKSFSRQPPSPPSPPSPPTATNSPLSTPEQQSLTNRNTNILKLLEESFPNSAPPAEDNLFGEIFSDFSTRSPWSIDTAKFEIVPAVPATGEIRVAKEASGGKKQREDINQENRDFIQFSPVPAVPTIASASIEMQARQPKNILETGDSVKNSIKDEGAFSEAETKKDGCLEKCVQQFCLPDKNLSLFSNCVEKCKTLCF